MGMAEYTIFCFITVEERPLHKQTTLKTDIHYVLLSKRIKQVRRLKSMFGKEKSLSDEVYWVCHSLEVSV